MADSKNRLVRMNTAMTGDSFAYAAGDIVECPPDVAERFIEKGVASAAPADAKTQHVYQSGPSALAKAQKEAAEKKAKNGKGN